MSGDDQWRFAPAYDLTFSNGPGGEQTMMVMGEGRNPGPEQLTALAKAHSLKGGPHILEKVREAVSRWREFARNAGVSAKSAADIAQVIDPADARKRSLA